MAELLMELTFKIGLTSLTIFIVMLMSDAFCKSVHEGESENKNIKYESPKFIDVVGIGSFFVLCGTIVLCALIEIWA